MLLSLLLMLAQLLTQAPGAAGSPARTEVQQLDWLQGQGRSWAASVRVTHTAGGSLEISPSLQFLDPSSDLLWYQVETHLPAGSAPAATCQFRAGGADAEPVRSRQWTRLGRCTLDRQAGFREPEQLRLHLLLVWEDQGGLSSELIRLLPSALHADQKPR